MTFDEVAKLQQRKYRERFGHFLIEGEHLILELQKAALRQPALLRSRLYVTDAHAEWQGPFDTQVISVRQMARICDTRAPQGIVAVVPLLPTPAPWAGERAFYLHEIQDPGNLGTLLRSLAWFGGVRCLLSPGSVDPYNPKAVRASMGALFHVPLETEVTLDSLPDRYARLACLDLHGSPLHSAALREFDCFLFGNEARGLPPDAPARLHAHALTVPGCGAIESMNLAAVATLCAYELTR